MDKKYQSLSERFRCSATNDAYIVECWLRKNKTHFHHFADCFSGAISFTDIDGVVERKGSLLIMEWKRSFSTPLRTGQRLTFETIVNQGGNKNVALAIEGEALHDKLVVRCVNVYYRGKWREYRGVTPADLKAYITKWFQCANARENVPNPECIFAGTDNLWVARYEGRCLMDKKYQSLSERFRCSATKGGDVVECWFRKNKTHFHHFADCFSGAISFTDIDGVVEWKGSLLIMEWKRSFSTPLRTGQRLTFETIVNQGGNKNVALAIEGEALHDKLVVRCVNVYYRGKWREYRGVTPADLKAYITKWFQCANARENVPNPECIFIRPTLLDYRANRFNDYTF